MRRFLIREILPLSMCLLLVVASGLIVLSVPQAALEFYLNFIRTSRLDWVILILGGLFFFVQIVLAWRALRWQDRGFDENLDALLERIYQAAEWFPLLGLFGTVAGILQTFGAISAAESVSQQEIVRLYAPALTTTGSGLLMAMINIVPVWMVAVGRRLILGLAMVPPSPGGER